VLSYRFSAIIPLQANIEEEKQETMFLIFYWGIALATGIPGLGLSIVGVVLLFQKKRRPAIIPLVIGLILLLVALGIVGWSFYEINVFCPANPAECG
jgi:DMSO reductase anchor subunit